MKLFNEIKNRYFGIITEAIHRIKTSPHGFITESEFTNIFTEGFDADKNAFKIAKEVLAKSMIFIAQKEEINGRQTITVRLSINSDVPIIPTEAEQLWLLSLLKLPEASIFLPDDMRADLTDTLSKRSSPIKPDFFAESKLHIHADELTPELSEKLRLVMSAIHSGHKLRYSNVTANGEIFTDCITSPIKIEYSIKSGMFRLSHYPDVSKRPVKSNLSRMYDLSILNLEVDKRTVSEMMKSRLETEPLIFTVYNSKHRAIERAKILFSEYPREITDNFSDDGTLKSVEFVLHYYSFQETELLREILSFGPRIKVSSPKHIAKQIVEKLNFAE